MQLDLGWDTRLLEIENLINDAKDPSSWEIRRSWRLLKVLLDNKDVLGTIPHSKNGCCNRRCSKLTGINPFIWLFIERAVQNKCSLNMALYSFEAPVLDRYGREVDLKLLNQTFTEIKRRAIRFKLWDGIKGGWERLLEPSPFGKSPHLKRLFFNKADV